MSFLRWFVFSNGLISVSAGMLAFGSAEFLASDLDPKLYGLFVFGATLFTYNFQRLVKVAFRDNRVLSSRNYWIGTHQLQLKALSFFGLILAAFIYFFYLFQLGSFLLLLPLVTISVLYAVRFFKAKNLRELPYVKIHLIAFVWMSASVLLPSISCNKTTLDSILFAISIYFYILAITIPFDIRDLGFDKNEQKTLPQLIGVNKSKLLALVCILISFLLFFTVNAYQSTLLLGLAFGVQITLILATNQKREELYFSGAIDGAITLLALALIF